MVLDGIGWYWMVLDGMVCNDIVFYRVLLYCMEMVLHGIGLIFGMGLVLIASNGELFLRCWHI